MVRLSFRQALTFLLSLLSDARVWEIIGGTHAVDVRSLSARGAVDRIQLVELIELIEVQTGLLSDEGRVL
jgi:hypothetical protein